MTRGTPGTVVRSWYPTPSSWAEMDDDHKAFLLDGLRAGVEIADSAYEWAEPVVRTDPLHTPVVLITVEGRLRA